MKLHELAPNPGATTSKKRLGRGIGSGLGKTAGKGHKGQLARSGGGKQPGFEGGQMPLARRVPKRGFHNRFGVTYAVINVERLNDFEDGAVVTPEAMQAAGVVGKLHNGGVKVLGDGALTRKLTVQAHSFTKQALAKIEAAGGKAEVI